MRLSSLTKISNTMGSKSWFSGPGFTGTYKKQEKSFDIDHLINFSAEILKIPNLSCHRQSNSDPQQGFSLSLKKSPATSAIF